VLIEVAGRPFLWHQLQLLKRNGIYALLWARQSGGFLGM